MTQPSLIQPVPQLNEATTANSRSKLLRLFARHQVDESTKTAIPDDNQLLKSITQKQGWSFHLVQGIPYLGINGTLVRYYDYPPEKYSLQVRKLILTNSVLELATLLGREYSSMPIAALHSQEEELRNIKGAPFCSISPNEKEELCKVLFFAGGKTLVSYIDALLLASNEREVRVAEQRLLVPGLNKLAEALWIGDFHGVNVYGKGSEETYNVHRKLACNMRFIADVDFPIEQVVSGWYQKLSEVKQDMMGVGRLLIDDFSDAASWDEASVVINLLAACFDLVDVRRSEAEYSAAVSSIEDESLRLTSSHTNALLWLTIVREPLSYGDFSGRLLDRH